MILSFTAIDKHSKFRDFFCELSNLEVALDVLTMITAQGDTILTAQVMDDYTSSGLMKLPVEALDGQSFSAPLQQLEKQWRAILKKPVRAVLPDYNWQIDLTRQRVKLYDERIILFLQTISHFEELRQRADDVSQFEPQRTNLISHYEATITRYQHFVDQEQGGQRQAQKKLNLLERLQNKG